METPTIGARWLKLKRKRESSLFGAKLDVTTTSSDFRLVFKRWRSLTSKKWWLMILTKMPTKTTRSSIPSQNSNGISSTPREPSARSGTSWSPCWRFTPCSPHHICMFSLISTKACVKMLRVAKLIPQLALVMFNHQVPMQKKLPLVPHQEVSKLTPNFLGRTSSTNLRLLSTLSSWLRSCLTSLRKPELIRILSTSARITWQDTSFLMLSPLSQSFSWMNPENTTALRSSDLSISTDWPNHCNSSFTAPSKSTQRRGKTISVVLLASFSLSYM